MTNKPLNWAKALAEQYAEYMYSLYFYYTKSGDVYYGVNNEDKGLFFSGESLRFPDLVGSLVAQNEACYSKQVTNPAKPGVFLKVAFVFRCQSQLFFVGDVRHLRKHEDG